MDNNCKFKYIIKMADLIRYLGITIDLHLRFAFKIHI